MEQETALINFSDSDDDLDVIPNRERFREAVLYGTDWTVRSILQQIENGNIDLSPNFQRRDAWGPRNKSRFIESVALQLPIPQIVLAERKEQRGTYIVLDGKQRLLTLAQFAGELPDDHWLWGESQKKSHLKLSGLKILSDLNGKTYQDLVDKGDFAQLRTQFDNHTIRSALIRNWPDDDYLYEVFIRLNTGSARLSPQELRQAMKPGPFTSFLNARSASSVPIQRILGLDGPDFRMRDVDLLLRTIAFTTRLSAYTGNLKPFLDDTHDLLNANWDSEGKLIDDLVNRIEGGLEFLIDQFGDPRLVGRRWSDGYFEGPVNRAVLDVQLASSLDPNVRRYAQEGKLDLVNEFIQVSEKQEFAQAISGTTKSIAAIRSRFNLWRNALEGAVGTALNFPALPND
ncbi:TPA: DUF262 domain-containing protein [Pseudomonas aeruginosa]|nr:DUF262 domain-containing protein [Pseudomonas aeruginosa]